MTVTSKRKTRWRHQKLLRHRWFVALMLAAGFLAAASASAQVARYTLDPVHTRVMFSISHAGYSNAIGTVSGSTGTLSFDDADWSSASLEARIPIKRIDLGDAKWNQAALAGNLLEAEKFPDASFVSTRIEPIDARHASVHGTLTLHGISKQIALDVTLNQVKRYPLPPFRRTAGFSASTQISRKDFGITAWPSVIGDLVELRIEAEAFLATGQKVPVDDNDPATTGSSPEVADVVPAQPKPVAQPVQENDNHAESEP